ncbi:MAG: gamma-glutamylcyclotransferase [Planctomycetes bacterium]|nr:gamma-glutamylcyclotransferase [Planctomycetota bacterium]
MKLFTYGSLMFGEVWSQLVRGDYVKRPARLQGFTRRSVHADVYPVIFKSHSSDWVDGFVYFGVSDEDLSRLDAFEGDAYDRQTHTVVVEDFEKHAAEAYVLKDCYKYLVNNSRWDPQWFAREALPFFIHNCRGITRH